MNIPFNESYAFFFLLGVLGGVFMGMFLLYWLIGGFDGER